MLSDCGQILLPGSKIKNHAWVVRQNLAAELGRQNQHHNE